MRGSVLCWSNAEKGLGKQIPPKELHGVRKDVKTTSKDKEPQNGRQEVQSGEEMVNEEGVCLKI